MIVSSSKPDDIVLDPFFGTGTTGAVAKRFGRRFIGIEREKRYVSIAENRLENEIDQSNDITNLSLEVKPPKVPMSELVRCGYIGINQELYNKSGEIICRVKDNGNVYDGEDELSIHKMSAKYIHRSNNNGWDYFYTNYNNKFLSIDRLRYIYKEERK